MEDEAGPDEKIIAVPVDALHPFYTDVVSYQICRPSSASRSRISSATTRTWRKANRCGSLVVGSEEAAQLVRPQSSGAPAA
jgi:hypothetical protein